jgi:hypothetical protein
MKVNFCTDVNWVNDILIRPCPISFVTIPRIERTSTMILTMMSVMAAVGRTSIYASRRFKEVFHAAKQVYKGILASANVLNGLRNRVVTKRARFVKKDATWRSTPIPAKIAFDGGNICNHTDQSIDNE